MHIKTDTVSGLLTIAIGIAIAFASTQYRIGSMAAMGTGYFPLMLSFVLVGLGALLLVKGRGEAKAELPMPPFREALLILFAPIAFGLLVTRVGLVAAIVAVATLGAFAIRGGTLCEKAFTVLAVTVTALLVFGWALGLPIPLIQWELG